MGVVFGLGRRPICLKDQRSSNRALLPSWQKINEERDGSGFLIGLSPIRVKQGALQILLSATFDLPPPLC